MKFRLILSAAAALSATASFAFTLAERGRSPAVPIVVDAGAGPSYRHAAEELRDYTERLTGVRPALVASANEPCVRLVASDAHGTDGFRLVADPSGVRVEGGVRGCLYGVYEILETYGGVGWFASWRTVVPRLERLAVPDGLDAVQRPAFEMRMTSWLDAHNGDFACRLRLNGARNGVGSRHGGPVCRFGRRLGACHTFGGLLPVKTYFKDHPEYYAMRDGKRTLDERYARWGYTQPCLTHPDVLRIMTSNVLAAIAADPTAGLYGVSQNDNQQYCTCPACAAVDAEEGSHAGTVVRFVNALAEEVEKHYPHAIIETLAYQYSRTPPKKTRLRHNVMPCLCSIECDFHRPLPASAYAQNVRFVSDIRGWKAQTDKLYLWDYTTNFRHYLHAFPNFNALQGNLRFYRDNGVKYMFEQGDSMGLHADFAELRTWLLAKWMWNPDRPAGPLLDRFFAGYYGAAAPFVRQYFDGLHALPRDAATQPLGIYESVLSTNMPTAFFERGAELWRQAKAAVADDPVCRTNVEAGALSVDYTLFKRLSPSRRSSVVRTRPTDDVASRRRELAQRLLAAVGPYRLRFSEGDRGNAAELDELRRATQTAKPIVGRDRVELSRVPVAGDFFGTDTAGSWLARAGSFKTPTGETDLHRYMVDRLAETKLPRARERLSWNEVNPKPGVWNFSHYLRTYGLYREKGIRVLGMFHDAPAWMEKKGKLPADLANVYAFCRRLGETFGDRVEAWEFWNEEDIGFCTASAWDYAAAAKAAYLGFKDARPDSPALMGALCRGTRGAYDAKLFENDLGLYTDAMNFHTYAPRRDQPRSFADVRKFLSGYGLGELAIWVTESGTHEEGRCEKDGVFKGRRAHSPEQERLQAEIAAQSLLEMMMSGISRDYFFVFPPYNESGGRKDWGVMRRDGTLKPVADVLKGLVTHLSDGELVGEVAGEKGARTYAFRRTDGTHVLCTVRDGAYPTYAEGGKLVRVIRAPQPVGRVGAPVAAPDEDRRIVLQLKTDDAAFELGGSKSFIEYTGVSNEMKLVVYNFDDRPKSGRVTVSGGVVEGLPVRVDIPAWGRVVLAGRYRPQTDRVTQTLTFAGNFGGRRTSRLVVRVTNPAAYATACDIIPLDLADPKRWQRNDSASSFETTWDAATGVRRFHLVWTNNVDRWVYPQYALRPNELVGGELLEFEIRSEQDKVENDFNTSLVMLFGPKAGARHLGYGAPLGTWEKRRIDLSAEKGLNEAKKLAIGANPRGHDLTYEIRNVRLYRAK